MQQGLVISVEAIDYAGKSTQVQLLFDRLAEAGIKVVRFHFPMYERPIGKFIKSILLNDNPDMASISDQALEMLYVADQLDFQRAIASYVSEGYTVILDRYDLSTIVYYSTIPGMMLSDAIKTVYHQWQGLLKKPDMTVILDLPPEKIVERAKGKLDRWEGNANAMAMASRNYRELAHILNDRTTMLVDASLSIDEVSNLIYKGVMEVHGKHGQREAGVHQQ